jgi:hypothetical protein
MQISAVIRYRLRSLFLKHLTAHCQICHGAVDWSKHLPTILRAAYTLSDKITASEAAEYATADVPRRGKSIP